MSSKAFRFAAVALISASAMILVVALAMQFKIRLSNEWQRYTRLDSASIPNNDSRILVFAPHSDDETLGCGGVLALAKQKKANLRVVLITNGDGYRLAVRREFKTIRATPSMCTQFAYQRQQETLRAMRALGVPSSSVTLLGYPDRGLAQLWHSYWGSDHLYTSPATLSDHSPYANSFTPNAPYCGESLLSDILRILKDDKPTDVYMPHPSDNHPDHYATYCFVTAALEQLRSENVEFAKRVKVHTYLVHRGDWPTPRAYHPKLLLAPPAALASTGTKWSSLELTSDAVRRKRVAVRSYKTQTALEPGFMMSFVRKNEVFGSLPVRRVVYVPDGVIHVDGDLGDWWRIPPAVIDPVGDYVVAGMNKGGDVRAIYLCADSRYMYLRLDCARRLSKRVTYTFNLRGLGASNNADLYSIKIKLPAKTDPKSLIWAYSGNAIEMALPRSEFNCDQDIFVQVVTKLANLTVDNTGWRSVEFTL